MLQKETLKEHFAIYRCQQLILKLLQVK